MSEPIPLEPVVELVPVTSEVWVDDIDLDGDLDILSREQVAGEPTFVSWRMNMGEGRFHEPVRQPPSDELDSYDYQLADIDGDGDNDLIRLGLRDDWIENRFSNGGSFDFENPRGFDSRQLYGEIVDLNGDGLADFIATNGWAEGVGDGTFIEHSLGSLYDPNATYTIDIDNDGDLDLATKLGGSELVIRENVGGDAVFADAIVTEINFGDAPYRDVLPFDVDRDGDEDLFLLNPWTTTDDGQLRLASWLWVENEDGRFDESVSRTFSDRDSPYPVAVEKFDIDGDGRAELLFYDGRSRSLGQFEDLEASAWSEVTFPEIDGDIPYALSGDFDNDGDLDWLGSTRSGALEWFDGVGDEFAPQVIADGTRNPGFPVRVTNIDFDRDGDQDLLHQRAGELFWHENRGGEADNSGDRFAAAEFLVAVGGEWMIGDISGDGTARRFSRGESRCDGFPYGVVRKSG